MEYAILHIHHVHACNSAYFRGGTINEMSSLPYVDPFAHRSRAYYASAHLIGTKAVGRFTRKFIARVDPKLMRLSRGRIRASGPLVTAVLGTTGAKTGAPRQNAVLYFHDGEHPIIVASAYGLPSNPAWYHNLRAHPEVTFGGRSFRAEPVADEHERNRLWNLADRVYPPYAEYRKRAEASGRTIPIVRLTTR
jgi:deazaflavin-dependent oxidoreductase (nitroreductase family)